MDVITTHLNADFDCLGSIVAARKLYPDAKVVFPGSQEKNVRDFLQHADFHLETESVKSIELREITRLILVDTKQVERIGEFAEIIHEPTLKIHLYDHHPGAEHDFETELEFIEDVGATTTIFVRLLQERQIPLSQMEATVMGLGIYEDTGSLTFSSTTEADLRAAADLFAQGADLKVISECINREMTPIQVRLLNDLLLSERELVIEGTPIAIAKASSRRYIGDAAFIVHKWKEMQNLDVVFALIQMDNKVHMVARSRGVALNVGNIAAEFGGGGHPYAASASIKQMTLNDVEEELLRVLHAYIQESHITRRIMSAPVLFVERDKSIQHTKALLDGYTVNTLLVLDRGHPLGYITRQIVQRAIYHGLEDESVSDYMLTDIRSVSPDTSFPEVELQMIQRPQKILPVVDEDGLAIGVITKNDILKVLQEYKLEEQSYYHNIEPHTRNVRRLMNERLPERILAMLHDFGRLGDEFGSAVYVVGGFVRDLLLRADENLDVDIVIEGDGVHFAKTLAQRCGARVKIHRKFCTGVVVFPDGFKVDVATARTEHYEYPTAMPIIKLGSIRLDLSRRDFTINALAIKLNPREFGKVYDFFGGQRDLKEKVIRVLHSLSFVEDPTRIFRAIRFEQRFHFRIGNLSLNLTKNAIKKGFVSQLSGQRVQNELRLMFSEPRPFRIVERMHELGVLRAISPRLSSIHDMQRLFPAIGSVLAWYQLLYRDEPAERWLLYFLGFVENISNHELLDVCSYLKITNKIMQKIHPARNGYHLIERPLYEKSTNLQNSDIYAVFKDLPLEAILFWMAKTKQEFVKKAVSAYLSSLQDIRSSVKGRDLIQLGLQPGPEFQPILNAVLNAKLNGEITSKEQEFEFLHTHVEKHSATPQEKSKINS
ncbi:MAG: CBS domain-containing protein [bacterium]|nr:CBS domain-containing protein [bacterium]